MKHPEYLNKVNELLKSLMDQETGQLFIESIGKGKKNLDPQHLIAYDKIENVVVKELPDIISKCFGAHEYTPKGSIGQGRIAETPWIRFQHKDDEKQPMYIVFFTSSNFDKIFVAFAAEAKSLSSGKTIKAKETILNYVKDVRTRLGDSKEHVPDFDIRNKQYVDTTAYVFEWNFNDINECQKCLDDMIAKYEEYLDIQNSDVPIPLPEGSPLLNNTSEIDNTMTDKTYWLVPSNESHFRLIDYFSEHEVVDWRQNNSKYKVGDVCFIYSSNEYKRVLHKTVVSEINIDKFDSIDDSDYYCMPDEYQGKYIRMQLVGKLDPSDNRLSLEFLSQHGVLGAIQNPRHNLNEELITLMNEVFNGSAVTTPSASEPSALYTEIFNIQFLIDAIKSTGLMYSDKFVTRFAYSLLTKPFVILSGLSGSGKTQLALATARALSENVDEQICFVSVGADWTNREPLLGYPNALKENDYVLPESNVLQTIIKASQSENKDKPFFLILDEMNLSYVERYFADFLSTMESRANSIKLWTNKNEAVPESVKLPSNLYIIGTINVDETTYMFSPKVLDRANVLEFKVSEDEMKLFLSGVPDIDIKKADGKCSMLASNFVERSKTKVVIGSDGIQALNGFFHELKAVNAEFGYRTASEIARFISLIKEDTALTPDEAIDAAIVQKLLPKLHGSRNKLTKVLEALWRLCFDSNVAPDTNSILASNVVKARYPLSADKILRMHDAVRANGFTSFAEA